jgi:hypothetical protein
VFVVVGGFSSVIQIGSSQFYAALVALLLNLVVAGLVTAIAQRRGELAGFGPACGPARAS